MKATENQRIETNFFERQAKENSVKGTSRGVMKAVALIALAAITFGGYQIYQFFANFTNNQYVRNISIVLRNPRIEDGKAVVTVEMQNDNGFDVENPRFKYQITGEGNKSLAEGELELDATVPAADKRDFKGVSLAPISGEPQRMHADLIRVTVDQPATAVPTGYALDFNDAMQHTGEERLEALKFLEEKAPTMAAIPTAAGMVHERKNRWTEAIDSYRKATEKQETYSNAHYRLGLALLHEKKSDEAVREIQKAAELNPKDKVIAEFLSSLQSEPQDKQTEGSSKRRKNRSRARVSN